MKEISVTVILFFLLIGGIVINSLHMNVFYKEMDQMVSALPAADDTECRARLYELEEYWNKKRLSVSVGVSYDDTERISEKLRLLTAAAEHKDTLEFELQRCQLATALRYVTRLERMSFESIF